MMPIDVQSEVWKRWVTWRDDHLLNQLGCLEAHCTDDLKAIFYVSASKVWLYFCRWFAMVSRPNLYLQEAQMGTLLLG